ncbi:hypothetical protein [Enterobacter hormaechei]|uniref:hypothetical protein n=1 Tax=Enterobacter hormaechei TaxID=158836 RepID=UPI00073BEA2F|nr:hypothetical protein [Enterobacter hormaechei]KTG93652.1 hypothetical protein ASV34_15980 [Enterobacter hormaechei subsp. xiangfangensis]KTH98061.1 hypothetical protein ASV12_05365 [Enterobacter hormaechei subsp. xiangfangensis]MDX7122304.1 hypothetical protein [Enterobacter hormaechei]HAS1749958.1 hypothetical protein [Enterobacter hormaechei subsp. oharae]
MDKQLYHIRWKLHHTLAELNYSLECFGDYLAKQNDYPYDIDGFEAIYLYLQRKYSWPLDKSRGMSLSDIRLALSVEMKGWTLPRDAIFEEFPGVY